MSTVYFAPISGARGD